MEIIGKLYSKSGGRGVMVKACETHNNEVGSSSPTRGAMKTPLVMEATGNHLIKSTSIENTQGPVSGFCYARNRECDAVFKTLAWPKYMHLTSS